MPIGLMKGRRDARRERDEIQAELGFIRFVFHTLSLSLSLSLSLKHRDLTN
jgi:hypothetical protein